MKVTVEQVGERTEVLVLDDAGDRGYRLLLDSGSDLREGAEVRLFLTAGRDERAHRCLYTFRYPEGLEGLE